MKKAILIWFLASTFSFSIAQVIVNQPLQTICVGTSTDLSASNATSYFWSPATGLNTTIGNTVIASPITNTIYTVTGFDSNGNSSTAIVTVVVNENPVVNLDVVQASSCNYINGLYVNPIYTDVKVDTNIVYGNNLKINGLPVDLKLDIYQPNQLVNYKRPAIVVFHGGGFLFGNKEDSVPVALSEYFAKRGYVVYDANYRVGMTQMNAANAGKAYYRAVQDAKACVRYIHKTGTDIGVDTSQIFFVGVSAGAMTGIATAYLDQNEIPSFIDYSSLGLLENAGGNAGYSSKVNAVVSISGGVYDTTTIFDNETEPLYSFHGTADGVIPYYSGLVGGQVLTYGGFSVNQAAQKSSLNSTLHTFMNGAHVPAISSPQFDTIFSESNSFLYSQVKYKHGENSCAMILATGGNQFAWSPTTALSNGNSGTLTATPDSLTDYSVTVTNNNGCSAQGSVTVKSITQLFGSVKIDTVLNHLNLITETSGGQEALSYLWSNGSTKISINHAGPGYYSVTVTSGNCQVADDATIIYPVVTSANDLNVDLVNSCSVTFSWDPMPGNLYQQVLLLRMPDSFLVKKIGLPPGVSVIDFLELTAGTNYKLEVFDYTWNDSTAGASSIDFKTKPCEVPILLTYNNVGDDHASIQWTGTCNPDSYRFRYREVGAPDFITKGTSDQFIDLTGLTPGTTYEYLVRTVCINGSNNYSKRSEVKTFTTTGLRTENAAYKIQHNDVQVFPNPAGGNFTLQAGMPEGVTASEIEILNSLGQVVYHKPVRVEDGMVDENISLNSKLTAGVYEVRVKNGSDYLKSRVVIR